MYIMVLSKYKRCRVRKRIKGGMHVVYKIIMLYIIHSFIHFGRCMIISKRAIKIHQSKQE